MRNAGEEKKKRKKEIKKEQYSFLIPAIFSYGRYSLVFPSTDNTNFVLLLLLLLLFLLVFVIVISLAPGVQYVNPLLAKECVTQVLIPWETCLKRGL